MKTLFELNLTEAKDQLSHINASIKETRTQIYFLIILMFGLVGYFSTDFFDDKFCSFKSQILYFTIPFVIIIIYFCRYAIVPIWLRFEGMSPKGFKSIVRDNDESTYKNILRTYQISIETNGKHLTSMSSGYNKAFKTLLVWSFCLLLYCVIIIYTKGSVR